MPLLAKQSKNMKIKQTFLFVAGWFIGLVAIAQTFTSQTVEGVDMTFKVISSIDKTVQVGSGENRGQTIGDYTGALTIPSVVNYNGDEYRVIAIGDYAFPNCKGLTSVEMSNNIATIGISAFFGCTGLTSIDIPKNVSSIKGKAFSNCSKLSSFTIGGGVSSIGSNAFSGTAWFNNQPNGLVYVGNIAYVYKGTMAAGTSIQIAEGTIGIADEAFNSRTALTSIDFPSSVKTIGYRAFYGCAGLTSVIIPKTVSTIGESAFANCKSIESVTLYTDIETIDETAFSDCEALDRINIDKVEFLGKHSIRSGSAKKYYVNGEQLTSIIIPEGTQTVEHYVSIADIKTVTIPSTVTSIKAGYGTNVEDCIYCFATTPPAVASPEYPNYEKCFFAPILYVPYGTKSAYQEAEHWGNSNLFSVIVEMPGNVEEVIITLNEAGTLKEALSELDVTKIRHLTLRGEIDANDIALIRAHEGRLSTLDVLDLKDVTLVSKDRVYYNSWTRAVDGTFYSYLTCICIGENGQAEMVTSEGVPSQASSWIVYQYYDNLAYAFQDMPFKRIVLPKSLKTIGDGTFENSDIEVLEMAENPRTIGENAFHNCSELRELPSLQNVSKMGDSAFSGCKRLAVLDNKHEINLTSLDSIHSYTFKDCTSINSFVLSSDLKSVGTDAFIDCTSLSAVNLPDDLIDIPYGAFNNTPWYNNLEWKDGIKYINKVAMESKNDVTALNFCDGTLAIADGFRYNQYQVSQIGLPSSIWYIGKGALANLNCTNVTLPSSLRVIGQQAFSRSSISTIVLPNTLEEVGVEAFFGCKQLTNVQISSSVKKIGEKAFQECALETLAVPASIEEIGNHAFAYNKSLLRVDYQASVMSEWIFSECTALERVTLSASMTDIPGYAFNNNSSLMKVIFPSSLETVGGSAFYGCTALKSLELPEGTKTIQQYAFRGCSGLLSVTIPSTVTDIESDPFDRCEKITDVTCRAKTVPTTFWRTFNSLDFANATLHVPATAIEEYKATEPWSSFGTIVALPEPDYVLGDVNSDGTVDISDYIGVANHILGNTPDGFNADAADVNGDGAIDISDYIGVANIILTGKP